MTKTAYAKLRDVNEKRLGVDGPEPFRNFSRELQVRGICNRTQPMDTRPVSEIRINSYGFSVKRFLFAATPMTSMPIPCDFSLMSTSEIILGLLITFVLGVGLGGSVVAILFMVLRTDRRH